MEVKLDPRVFPTILLVLDIFASIPYGMTGNWRRCAYWLFAAGLTFVVTW